jgi:hypothetical protein
VGAHEIFESLSNHVEELFLRELNVGKGCLDRSRRGNVYRCAVSAATKHVRGSLWLVRVIAPVWTPGPEYGA